MNDESLVAALGQQIRVDIRWGTGVPLVLCNGIGASLEVLDPFVAQLDPDTTVVRFDVPGSGASPDSPFPYRFPYLAAVLGTLLKKVGIIDRRAGLSQVDVLGLSPVPQAHTRIHRYRFADDSRETVGAGEDVDGEAIPGSSLCRHDRA